MELSTSQRRSGGCIILLDVPPGSSITIDGITRLTPSSSSLPSNQHESTSSLHNSGVLIISGIPSNSTSSSSTLQDQFHLLIVRCGATHNTHNQRECDIRTLPVGFILASLSSTNNISHKKLNTEFGYDWIFARRYDPLTEEISNQPVDELTLNNIILAMRNGGELSSTTTAALTGGMLGRNIVMTYDQFVQSTSSNSAVGGNRGVSISSWDARTTCINSTYLQRRHAVTHGDKIVPSSYDQEEQTVGTSNNKLSSAQAQHATIDGKQISYPQIPCIDPSINARRLMQHAGTRLYLSKLSPEIRTKLLLGSDDSFHVGEYVWNDMLSRVYDSSSDNCNSGNFKDFLADVQLSFLMFLFLECHTSLEHWRDAISMCSLAVIPTDDKGSLLQKHASFFKQLLSIIYDQFMCIETEFFQEVEYSSGQRNFLIQALERLCGACDDLTEGEQSDIDGLKLASSKLKRMLRDRFELSLTSSGNKDADMEIEEECPPIVYDGNKKAPVSSERTHGSMEQEYNDEEDEDGPVIVPYDEFESSISRLNTTHKQVNDDPVEAKHRESYPLLFAAMAPQEDVVMCAARCLDEQRDVSLMREAAAYLEEVEANRCSS